MEGHYAMQPHYKMLTAQCVFDIASAGTRSLSIIFFFSYRGLVDLRLTNNNIYTCTAVKKNNVC